MRAYEHTITYIKAIRYSVTARLVTCPVPKTTVYIARFENRVIFYVQITRLNYIYENYT